MFATLLVGSRMQLSPVLGLLVTVCGLSSVSAPAPSGLAGESGRLGTSRAAPATSYSRLTQARRGITCGGGHAGTSPAPGSWRGQPVAKMRTIPKLAAVHYLSRS